MSDDGPELPPSVPSEPFDELFSLAFRFRCPSNLSGGGGFTPVARRTGCGPKRATKPPRALTSVCLGIRQYSTPLALRRNCPPVHRLTKFVRFAYSNNCRRFKQYNRPFSMRRTCDVRHGVLNLKLNRVHFPVNACKKRPVNTEWPMRRSLTCQTSHRALASKVVIIRPKMGTVSCRTYKQVPIVMTRTCPATKAFKFSPSMRKVNPSFLCYASELVTETLINLKFQAAQFCPKSIKPNFVVDNQKIVHTSVTCNVPPPVVISGYQRLCVPLFARGGLLSSDGAIKPLFQQAKNTGMSCRAYPLSTLNPQAYRAFCTLRHVIPNKTGSSFPFGTRRLRSVFCFRTYPLQSSFNNQKAICGTIALANAPIIVFGRVWGGQESAGITPPTSGRVGGLRFRNLTK